MSLKAALVFKNTNEHYFGGKKTGKYLEIKMAPKWALKYEEL